MNNRLTLTGTTHILSLDKLDQRSFERLCLWLVDEEGYVHAEHYGLAGSDRGRDVIAHKEVKSVDQLWYFQCKRTPRVGPRALLDEAEKILALGKSDPQLMPFGIVFVVSGSISGRTRDTVRRFLKINGIKARFWGLTELDKRVKNHENILREFFQVATSSPINLVDTTVIVEIGRAPPHNTLFVGRGSYLEAIDSCLAIQPKLACVLVGMQGVGKTRIAAEYYYKHSHAQHVVGWIRAESDHTIIDSYIELAKALRLRAANSPKVMDTINEVKSELAARSDWLLVFDNVPNPKVLRRYLPPVVTGNVICTSRDPGWGNLGRTISVKPFDRAESVAFLSHFSREQRPGDFGDLAEELGDLPLGLVQAGSYMQRRVSATAYMDLLRSKGASLLAERSSVALDYGVSLGASLRLSTETVRRKNQGAFGILAISAYLDPDDIPAWLFVETPDMPHELRSVCRDTSALTNAMVFLRQSFWIPPEDDSLSIHRLVQLVTRDMLAVEGANIYQNLAFALVVKSLVHNSESTAGWPKVARIAPHAIRLAPHFKGVKMARPVTLPPGTAGAFASSLDYLDGQTQLLQPVAAAFARTGRLDEARSMYEQELKGNVEESARADILSELGLVYRRLGMLRKSVSAYKSALMTFEKSGREIEAAHVYCGMGMAKEQGEDTIGAEVCFRNMHKLSQGLDNKHVNAKLLHCEGRVHAYRGERREAFACYDEAVKLYEEVGRFADQNNIFMDWAVLLLEKRSSRKASELCAKARDSYRNLKDKPALAAASVNLGISLYAEGRVSEAFSVWQEASGILAELVPTNVPSVRQGQSLLDSRSSWVNWLSMYDPQYQRRTLGKLKRFLAHQSLGVVQRPSPQAPILDEQVFRGY